MVYKIFHKIKMNELNIGYLKIIDNVKRTGLYR